MLTWLVIILMLLGGFLVPLYVPSSTVHGDVTGAWGGALIAGAAALIGIQIATFQTRRNAISSDGKQRERVCALIVAEMTVLAERMVSIVPIIDKIMAHHPHNEPVSIGHLRQRVIGSMPLTRLIAPQITLLLNDQISALTRFLTELDLFLSDLGQFSAPEGSLPYWTALFLQTRLHNFCEQLSHLFEIMAPNLQITSEAGASEPAATVLGRLANPDLAPLTKASERRMGEA